MHADDDEPNDLPGHPRDALSVHYTGPSACFACICP